MIKNNKDMSFAELLVSGRKTNMEFFDQINKLIDFNKVEQVINKLYQIKSDAVGNSSWSGLLLFKINLLGMWYALSDEQLEISVNDRISFSQFVGLPLDQSCPDHSTIWRFRERMKDAKAWDKLLDTINEQLIRHKVIVKTGVNVDASITKSPNTPKGPLTIDIAEDRKEDERSEEVIQKEEDYMKTVSVTQPCADEEARWLKKGNKSYFGYKKHTGTTEQGIVLGVHTTSANESDTKQLPKVIDKCKLQEGCSVNTDKGYSSKANRDYLKSKKFKDRIQHKAVRGKGLTHWQLKANRLISKKRYTIERTFGSITKWFKAGECRYKGLARTHTQHILEAICYNLKVAPGIIASNSKKWKGN
jgi:IS5 family transposase